MRLRDGRLICALCGARLDIPTFAKPETSFVMAPGPLGHRRMRILTLDNVEIHRCPAPARR